MTYTVVQPTQQPSPGPDVPVTGHPSGAFVWVGVVLLVLAVAFLFRPRNSSGE